MYTYTRAACSTHRWCRSWAAHAASTSRLPDFPFYQAAARLPFLAHTPLSTFRLHTLPHTLLLVTHWQFLPLDFHRYLTLPPLSVLFPAHPSLSDWSRVGTCMPQPCALAEMRIRLPVHLPPQIGTTARPVSAVLCCHLCGGEISYKDSVVHGYEAGLVLYCFPLLQRPVHHTGISEEEISALRAHCSSYHAHVGPSPAQHTLPRYPQAGRPACTQVTHWVGGPSGGDLGETAGLGGAFLGGWEGLGGFCAAARQAKAIRTATTSVREDMASLLGKCVHGCSPLAFFGNIGNTGPGWYRSGTYGLGFG